MGWTVEKLDSVAWPFWDRWDAIVSEAHRGNPMLCAPFVRLLTEFFGSELYAAWLGDSDSGHVLVILERRRMGVWRVFKPSQAQVALLVTNHCDRIAVADLVQELPGFVLKLDFFGLDPEDHESVIDGLPEDQRERHHRDIHVDIDGEFDDYWASRPRKLRQNVNRYQNRLQKELGEYELKWYTSCEDVALATDLYGMLESRGWKGRAGTALHPANLQGQFYRQYMALMASRGQALAVLMTQGGVILAARLCVFSDDLLVTLKTTYNEEFKKHGVGRILLKELIAYVFKRKLSRVIDFYTNATSDQLDWSSGERFLVNATVTPANSAGLLVNLVLAARSRMRGEAEKGGGEKHVG